MGTIKDFYNIKSNNDLHKEALAAQLADEKRMNIIFIPRHKAIKALYGDNAPERLAKQQATTGE